MSDVIQKHVEQIDAANASLTKAVEFRDSLLALHKNKHFIKVILEGYLQKEAADKVKALGVPNLQGEQEQREIMNALQGIAHFNQFLRNVLIVGDNAERSIASNEDYRVQVLNGEIDLGEDQ